MIDPRSGCYAGRHAGKKTMNKASPEAEVPTSDPLKRAADCAKAGDPVGMMTALAERHGLDGFVRYFVIRYSKVPQTAVEDAVAIAMDKAYDHIRQGRSIANLAAWLWKVIDNELKDAWIREYRFNTRYDEAQHGDAVAASACGGAHHRDLDLDRQRMHSEALRIAREILPTLGHENVRAVMKLLIDAAESGIEDLPHAQIAETLDLHPSTVRVLVHRGLERLARAARGRGLHLDRTRLDELFPGHQETEDFDEEDHADQ